MTLAQLPGIGAFAWRQEEPRWYENVAECIGEMTVGGMLLTLYVTVRWDHTAYLRASITVGGKKRWESLACLAYPKRVADRKALIDELLAQGLTIPPRTTTPPEYSR